jgi:hypothetical protein
MVSPAGAFRAPAAELPVEVFSLDGEEPAEVAPEDEPAEMAVCTFRAS